MVNEELLRRVIKRIERDKNWHQGYWGAIEEETFADKLSVSPVQSNDGQHRWLELKDVDLGEKEICGTQFCLAGHTILEAGDVMLVDKNELEANFCIDDTGAFRTIEQRATELLGLDDYQADLLFAPSAGNYNIDLFKQEITDLTGVEFD